MLETESISTDKEAFKFSDTDLDDAITAIKKTLIFGHRSLSQVLLEILTESALSDISWFYRCNIKGKYRENPCRKDG